MTPEPAQVWAAAEDVEVTRVAEDRWSDVRAVRLAALADSPTAFGSSLHSEVSFDEGRWREWVRSAALFVALANGAPVGMAAGVAGQTSAERKLVALWVAPDWRGRNTAERLVASVLTWAQSGSVQRVTLWVTDGNTSAQRLYQRFGFEETGVRKPVPSNPALTGVEMVLELR